MGLRPVEIFQFFLYGDRLYTWESDVYRRQIPTYKDGPRTERVKFFAYKSITIETNYFTEVYSCICY